MVELTASMRGSYEALFPRLRELLEGRGIDPNRSTLVEMFSDDRGFEYGIVTTPDGGVYQFGLDCMGRTPDAAELIEWIDWTRTYHLAAFRGHVEVALKMRPDGEAQP
jgi:hypothetical protein